MYQNFMLKIKAVLKIKTSTKCFLNDVSEKQNTKFYLINI